MATRRERPGCLPGPAVHCIPDSARQCTKIALHPSADAHTGDVQIHQDLGSHLMASYTEWQVGGREPGQLKNGRLTTVLLSKQLPIQWLHVHETWLPDAAQAAGPYDF